MVARWSRSQVRVCVDTNFLHAFTRSRISSTHLFRSSFMTSSPIVNSGLYMTSSSHMTEASSPGICTLDIVIAIVYLGRCFIIIPVSLSSTGVLDAMTSRLPDYNVRNPLHQSCHIDIDIVGKSVVVIDSFLASKRHLSV
jgi:hypothetical protein